jgi:hypothetical protein
MKALTAISSMATWVSSACHLPLSPPDVWALVSRISSDNFFPTWNNEWINIFKVRIQELFDKTIRLELYVKGTTAQGHIR